MRKLIASIHSTANSIVTGPVPDETNFMIWAQAGIEDSLQSFLKSLTGVDTILLGRATYEDLMRKWPQVKEWPQMPDAALRIGEKLLASRTDFRLIGIETCERGAILVRYAPLAA